MSGESWSIHHCMGSEIPTMHVKTLYWQMSMNMIQKSDRFLWVHLKQSVAKWKIVSSMLSLKQHTCIWVKSFFAGRTLHVSAGYCISDKSKASQQKRWTDLAAVQLFHQLKICDASWNEKWIKEDPGLLKLKQLVCSSQTFTDYLRIYDFVHFYVILNDGVSHLYDSC